MTRWRELLACATCVGFPWEKADLGFLWSTLFLMALPVGVAGLIGGWLYYSYKRSAPRRAGKAVADLVVREKESRQ